MLRPRLRVTGADLNRIGFLTGKYKSDNPTVEFLLNLKDDLSAIETALPKWEAELGLPIRMIVVDPFLNHLGSVNPNKEGEVRPLLAELAAFLRRTGLALLGIRHLNKSQDKAILYRAGGSIAFTGAARAEYLVGKDPDNPERRIFAHLKGNLAVEPVGLAYKITGSEPDAAVSILTWLGTTETSACDVINPPQDSVSGGGPQKVKAKTMLLGLLGDGRDVPVSEVKAKAEELGIGRNSLYSAARDIGASKHPSAFRKGWVWSLTEDVHEEARS